ncbi:nucleotidyltransferase [candidate division WOR-1 bacterium RIFOXYA12_FULL_43_27]|uniref:Nucleotidyltransferase n=1 Tax=candidate division WOR-1 bacterium RIFOXYC2_FULL_46_14 TaxID=1802587 RepID=A0A1F4U6A9_UNCSA|nr:MAG: nucleotidyltransferase [candidate division WOR-1 bacterium RIFOXYA12_FULL_43_27]OGC20248.1 MAG: nucleotidyltransferase [candidate division WOR-1 bacterium RIFOXYB2_FULL_46_45]OGC32311.1 MAG: nucleotidyltransferase [candidate division WOR-1 bacterium RIFOXYA2_FULL_46_56]OGC40486.1 MAG: nucleotidyltransferase [candidate division WOR-1 bacterium RIFOXYC2_FULL_46_14]
MSKLERIKRVLKGQKRNLSRKYGISEIGIFGSFVRGEEKKRSDLDLLVRLNKRMGLLKFIGIENHLSDLLGIKVDLVMKDALKPTIGKYILDEVVYI